MASANPNSANGSDNETGDNYMPLVELRGYSHNHAMEPDNNISDSFDSSVEFNVLAGHQSTPITNIQMDKIVETRQHNDDQTSTKRGKKAGEGSGTGKRTKITGPRNTETRRTGQALADANNKRGNNLISLARSFFNITRCGYKPYY